MSGFPEESDPLYLSWKDEAEKARQELDSAFLASSRGRNRLRKARLKACKALTKAASADSAGSAPLDVVQDSQITAALVEYQRARDTAAQTITRVESASGRLLEIMNSLPEPETAEAGI